MAVRAYLPGLDALRGVAALAVLLLHVSYVFGTTAMVRHGYLAVDFFFMLSGFVLAHAYEGPLRDGLGLRAIMAGRLRRLYPLVTLGVMLGTCGAVIADLPRGQIVAATLGGILLIPHALSPELSTNAFAIDPPLWSLFWELLASAALATFLFRSSLRQLVLIQAIAFVLLLTVAQQNATLEVGFEWHDFLAGGSRAAFAFTTGIVLLRLHDAVPVKAGGVPIAGLAIMLALVLAPPVDGIRWVYDMVAVTVVFPAIIWSAAAVPRVSRPWRTGAALSYPLYIVHIPILSLVQARAHGVIGAQPVVAACIGAMLALVAAVAAYLLWDRPIREWRSQMMRRDRKRRPSGRPSRVSIGPA